MYIASQKHKENIAEYLLYMWHIEDIIRASGLDIDRIRRDVISKSGLTPEQERETTEWYESLIDMMRREGVEQKGHLQLNKNVLIALTDLHLALLADPRYASYTAEFYRTLPYIVELRAKSGDNPPGELEACFNALYGMLMLRLQGRETTPATREAIEQISRFIAALAAMYNRDREGTLFTPDDTPDGGGASQTPPPAQGL